MSVFRMQIRIDLVVDSITFGILKGSVSQKDLQIDDVFTGGVFPASS